MTSTPPSIKDGVEEYKVRADFGQPAIRAQIGIFGTLEGIGFI